MEILIDSYAIIRQKTHGTIYISLPPQIKPHIGKSVKVRISLPDPETQDPTEKGRTFCGSEE